MTTIDWKALKPHIPLGPGDAQYVERTGSAGDQIAQWVRVGRSPLLVGGPAGVGKSTELARAAELLGKDRIACLARVDREQNMRRLTPDGLAQTLHGNLRASADATSLALVSPAASRGQAVDQLHRLVAELVRVAGPKPVTLLIDGLEKVPQGPEALGLFELLGMLDDVLELVVVIPWHAAFGPQADTIIRAGERFMPIRPLEVESATGAPGRAFLTEVLLRRLQWSEGSLTGKRVIIDEAITLSDGMPRTFLQLVAGAGTYATLRRDDPWPTLADLQDEAADHVDSIARVLLPGDVAAIRAAAGTTGVELEVGRKIRLMAHGVLIERVRDGVPLLEVARLAQRALDRGAAHA